MVWLIEIVGNNIVLTFPVKKAEKRIKKLIERGI